VNILAAPAAPAGSYLREQSGPVVAGQHDAKSIVDSSVASQGSVAAPKTNQQAILQLNKKLDTASTQVVFAKDPNSDRVWLNVVDKSTGKVITELPPETIRKIVDGYASTSGLVFDKFR